jgi:hypothetical protein
MNRSLTLIVMFATLRTMNNLAQKSPKPYSWKHAGGDDRLRKAFERAFYCISL